MFFASKSQLLTMARMKERVEVLWGDLNEINDNRVKWFAGTFALDGDEAQFQATDGECVHIKPGSLVRRLSTPTHKAKRRKMK